MPNFSMHFHQFYLGCLAHASYLIGSDGEAAVIDPQRDVDQYIEYAERHGLAIRWVIETHLHADFVSGHRELAERTGAEIAFGARADAQFPHRAVHDGDVLRVGSIELRALETPGHTPESVSWLIIDSAVSSDVLKVLTGDTLFIGDVGRPDLAGSRGYTPEMMAGMLYDSLHRKLLTLPDSVEVYPAHGAGSACGRNISKETSSTIGEQRRMNYALQPMPREEFIRMMTSDLPEAPSYFPIDAEINRRGAGALGDLQAAPLSPADAGRLAREGATLLDVRDGAAFGTGHVPGSTNIGLRGQFASWAGSLLDPATAIVIIAEGAQDVEEAVIRLARVGFENVAGYLEGGIASWHEAGLPLATLAQIDVGELKERLRERDGRLQIIDVRRPGEYASGHVPDATNHPLASITRSIGQLDAERAAVVVCASGYRSSIASSLLEREGFRELYNVTGGTNAWISSGFETES
ncbi:MAG TPA: MBL fold metallo-hydrolase [Thermoanaerobaculia bacterium]|nr:MBL fold metallo-hydrolase [Thermoanaerobaculia bacterium]